MTISKDLMLSILAMNAYNKGYGQGIMNVGEDKGPASIDDDSSARGATPGSESVGFYAVDYTAGDGVDGVAPGTNVISYRGTDRISDHDASRGASR